MRVTVLVNRRRERTPNRLPFGERPAAVGGAESRRLAFGDLGAPGVDPSLGVSSTSLRLREAAPALTDICADLVDLRTFIGGILKSKVALDGGEVPLEGLKSS